MGFEFLGLLLYVKFRRPLGLLSFCFNCLRNNFIVTKFLTNNFKDQGIFNLSLARHDSLCCFRQIKNLDYRFIVFRIVVRFVDSFPTIFVFDI